MDEDIKKDLDAFKSLLEDHRWKAFCRVLDDNIEFLDKQIIEGKQKREEIDKLRERRKAYWQIRNTPEEMIVRLTEQPVNMDMDPYEHSSTSGGEVEFEIDKETSK